MVIVNLVLIFLLVFFPVSYSKISKKIHFMREWEAFSKKERAPSHLMHEICVAVKQNNIGQLKKEILDRSNPNSLRFRDWMNYDEVGQLIQNDNGHETVLGWALSKGVEVLSSTKRKEYIRLRAPIAIWEDLLDADFHMYEHVEKNVMIPRAESFIIPEYLNEHVTSFFMVSDFPIMKDKKSVRGKIEQVTMLRRKLSVSLSTVAFLDTLYNIDSNIGSSGASQAVFETESEYFSPDDLTDFQNLYGYTVQAPVVVNGHSATQAECSTVYDCYEGNLDLQLMMGISQVTETYYWYTYGKESFTRFLFEVADALSPPQVLSISWGIREQVVFPSAMDAFDIEAMKLAAMGITVVVASGDYGVSGTSSCYLNTSSIYSSWLGDEWAGLGYSPSWPATSPWVVAVGATMGPNTGDVEVACQGAVDDGGSNGVITTGGGFSTYFEIPSWQSSTVSSYFTSLTDSPPSGYNPNGRAYPDVSFLGTYYPTMVGGEVTNLFGTSASAPLFGAMISLINGIRLSNGLSTVGFINPVLYDSGNSAAFNDITAGNNSCKIDGNLCCDSGFVASSGWDPVTGLGSIDFDKLKSILGTTVDKIPTPTPTAAPAGLGVPTVAPTFLEQEVGYVVTAINTFSCESSKNGKSGNFDYLMMGTLVNTCLYIEGGDYSDYSVRYVIDNRHNYTTFVNKLNFSTTDCTGPYVSAPFESFVPYACTDLFGTHSMFTYFTTDTIPWSSNKKDGLVQAEYGGATACSDNFGVVLPSSFVWSVAGKCVGGSISHCNSHYKSYNRSFGYDIKLYSDSECTELSSSQKGNAPQLCVASTDDDGYDDDLPADDYYYGYYYFQLKTSTASMFCAKGTGELKSDVNGLVELASIIIISIGCLSFASVFFFGGTVKVFFAKIMRLFVRPERTRTRKVYVEGAHGVKG